MARSSSSKFTPTTARFFRRIRPWLAATAVLALGACDDDSVRFGPPNNLQLPGGATAANCPPPDGATGEECPEWETVVFPLFESYGCTNAACHSVDNPSGDLALYEGDPQKTYEALAAYTNGAGRPYVADADSASPNAPPYMICNMSASPPIGPRMPPSGLTPEDLVIVGNWALCGMRLKGGTPTSPAGSGGAGGAGGQGAGGA